MKALTHILPALLALAACDGGTPGDGAADADIATDERPADAGTPSPAEAALLPEPMRAPAPTQIPASIQGRWGLTSVDCEPGRDDAKGLLAITGNKLEFYESVGMLTVIEEAEGSRIRAAFDFTGEGMSWQRDVVLDVQDGGQTLIRREYGADAAPGPFRYTRCNQRT